MCHIVRLFPACYLQSLSALCCFALGVVHIELACQLGIPAAACDSRTLFSCTGWGMYTAPRFLYLEVLDGLPIAYLQVFVC